MAATKREYGLLISRNLKYGTDYVIAQLVRRDDDGEQPLGCDSNGESSWDKCVPRRMHGLQLDGLCMHGFVSDFSDASYIGFQPEYRDVFCLDMPKARRSHKTLKRVYQQIERDKATEAGDVFASFAKALGLSFVVRKCNGQPDSSWDNMRWQFMDVANGRNAFRAEIEAAQDEARKRLRDKGRVA
jgi:hypothetical protein